MTSSGGGLTKSLSFRRLRPLPQLRLTPEQPLRLLPFNRSAEGQHGPGSGNKVLKLHRFTLRLQELSLMLPRNRVVRVRRSPMSPSNRISERARPEVRASGVKGR